MMTTPPLKVPVTLYGSIIGEALIGPEGQVFIDIDTTPKGKEMREVLLMGFIDHLSLVPQHHYILQKREENVPRREVQ